MAFGKVPSDGPRDYLPTPVNPNMEGSTQIRKLRYPQPEVPKVVAQRHTNTRLEGVGRRVYRQSESDMHLVRYFPVQTARFSAQIACKVGTTPLQKFGQILAKVRFWVPVPTYLPQREFRPNLCIRHVDGRDGPRPKRRHGEVGRHPA